MKQRKTVQVKQACESDKILSRSSLYREFKKEREEINKLKWIESEKQGKDIGYEKALLMWAHSHRKMWKKSRRKQSKNSGKWCACN